MLTFAANILWFIFGGWFMGLAWWLAAILMAVSVIGLPWTRACFEIGLMSFAPFGSDVVSVAELSGDSNPVGEGFVLIANIIWFPLGLILAVIHLAHGVAAFCTIIGIPFALQDFKLAGLSLFPVGKRVVSNELAEAARMTNAYQEIDRRRY